MTDIKKSCTSCGGDGHHWNECQTHSIYDALHKGFGLEPLLGWQTKMPETMTDIDKLAREIAGNAYFTSDESILAYGTEAARLGILEGMKLQRERDAVIAESLYEQSALVGDCDTEIKRKAVQQAAAAIRSAL